MKKLSTLFYILTLSACGANEGKNPQNNAITVGEEDQESSIDDDQAELNDNLDRSEEEPSFAPDIEEQTIAIGHPDYPGVSQLSSRLLADYENKKCQYGIAVSGDFELTSQFEVSHTVKRENGYRTKKYTVSVRKGLHDDRDRAGDHGGAIKKLNERCQQLSQTHFNGLDSSIKKVQNSMKHFVKNKIIHTHKTGPSWNVKLVYTQEGDCGYTYDRKITKYKNAWSTPKIDPSLTTKSTEKKSLGYFDKPNLSFAQIANNPKDQHRSIIDRLEKGSKYRTQTTRRRRVSRIDQRKFIKVRDDYTCQTSDHYPITYPAKTVDLAKRITETQRLLKSLGSIGTDCSKPLAKALNGMLWRYIYEIPSAKLIETLGEVEFDKLLNKVKTLGSCVIESDPKPDQFNFLTQD